MPDPIRVLVVDDDANITMALKIIISTTFSCEAVDTAADGMEAWEKIQSDDYDLVLSDWNMPRMNGDELLRRMKESEQTRDILFLMLTVRKDVESVALAVKAGIADYVIKPFDKDVLALKIAKLLARIEGNESGSSILLESERKDTSADVLDQKTISVRVMELIGKGEINLPTMPQIIFAIQDEMKKEGAGVPELARLIEQDPAISSKLIGVANSVYYRGTQECSLVEDAIARLGLEATKQFVYLVGNKNLYSAKNRLYDETTRGLYLHALACAAASQSLAEQLHLPDAHNYFTLGLLHDIGKLLVLQVLAEMTGKMRGIDLTLSLEIMNELHNKAGYMLLSNWSFPPLYAAVALNHEDLSTETEPAKEFLVVYIANLVSRELGYTVRTEPSPDLLNTKEARLMKLNKAILDKAQEDATMLITKMTALF